MNNNNPYGQSSYYQQQQQNQNNPNVPVTPAYFDAAGQPRAATKMSTVGSASATDSAYEGTTTASISATSQAGTNTETAPDLDDGDDRSMTMNLDPRDPDTDMPTTSPPASGYATGPDTMMDDDEERLATRSVGTFDDRMSDYDDGRESLVGFGEGAGSTVSGPIYHRRPLPGQVPGGPPGWGLERSSSGLSDMLPGGGGGGPPPTSSGSVGRGGSSGGGRDVIRDIIRREGGMLQDRDYNGSGGNDSTPGSSQSAAVSNERRDARMMDGIAFDQQREYNFARFRNQFPPMDEDFVDTTATGPLPLPHNYSPTSAGRHQQRPGEERPRSNQQQHPYPFQQYQHHQQQQGQQYQPQHSQTYSEFQLRPMDVSSPITPQAGEANPRETAERMLENNVTGHDWKNI